MSYRVRVHTSLQPFELSPKQPVELTSSFPSLRPHSYDLLHTVGTLILLEQAKQTSRHIIE